MNAFAAKILMLALFCLYAAPVFAQPYGSDWQAAMQSSSARLKLFALMAQRPDGAAKSVATLQHGQGFAHIPGNGPQIISRGLRLAPVLRYDSNINGGTPGETILISGLSFNVPPESRAREGVIFGASVGGSARLSLSPTTIFESDLSASLAKGQGSSVQSSAASLCLGQFLGGANWLDLCLARNISERALSQSDQTTASLGLTQQFSSDFALSEADIKLHQSVTKQYRKLSLDMGLTMARAQWGVLETRAEFGQFIAGQHTRLFGANLSLIRPILGADTLLYASYAREGGAAFFGTPRKDQVFSLGLSRQITKVLGLNLSLQDRQSTLANYDGVTLGIDFTFRDLTF